jgi:hypothetical protein
MPTNGKSLELLVEVLEKMDMVGAEIKTRDKIYDKVAKELREVDVSVRFQKGSHDFLIVFECRDRTRKNGPDWIEQIVQKTRDLGANKVIAVSSSGFTEGAIEKAKHYDIVIRTIEEISVNDIFDWFQPKSLPIIVNNFNILGIYINGKNSDSDTTEEINSFISQHKEKIRRTFPFILQKDVLNPRSPNELLMSVDSNSLFSGIVCEAPSVTRKIELYPEDKTSGFRLIIDDDILDIDHLTFVVELSVVEKISELSSVREYKTDDKSIAQILKFGEIDFSDGKKIPEFVLKPEGIGTCLSIRFKEPE